MERLNRIQDPTLPEEAHIARATSHLRRALTRFRSSVYQPEDGEDGHILAQVWSALANTLLLHDEPFPLRPIRLVDQPGVLYLLFFDGGSRGNTGTGGSGSVIVKVHTPTHTACIVSVASMAYGNPTTTNDFAEYQGLVHGLRRAKEGVLSPRHVVGDSALVLSQLRTYRSPRKPQLEQLYDVARILADDVAVVSRGYHYRDCNKNG
uniref:RNase H type-1 domain-containing protein n=1 Tax=Hyaloperonospora arabidopsidis (strain Emoy2) TaxID=559515 RepID=M4B758_HYAAE